jgi:hypothetical protein
MSTTGVEAMATTHSGKVLLTLDDVYSWQRELGDIEQMMAELADRRSSLARKLEQAAPFIPTDAELAPHAPAPSTGTDESDLTPDMSMEGEASRKRIRGGLVSPQPMPVLVLGLFSGDEKIAPGDAVDRVLAIEGVSGPLGAIKNNVYTALQRLMQRKQLRRYPDGSYSLMRDADLEGYQLNENEAPAGIAEGASEAGEAATSPIENRQGFRLVG